MTRLKQVGREHPGLLLLVVVLVGLVLRVANLGGKSLWLDEAISLQLATPTFTQVDPLHPPLYYVALHYWADLFGQTEATLRLPSALLSLLNVALLYRLGRKLTTHNTALLAAALLALSPLNLWYAQEARMYAALVTVALTMAVGLATRRFAGYLLFSATLSAGLYLDYLVFPMWVGLSAIWFALWWQQGHQMQHVAGWLVASALAWALYLPWWPFFQEWLQVRLLGTWMFGRLRMVLGLPRLDTTFFLLLLLLAATALAAATATVQNLLKRSRARRVLTWLLLAGFLAGVLFTPVPRLFGLKRVLVTGWPFVILTVAWVLTSVTRHGNAVISFLLAVSIIASVATLFLPKDDWRGLAAYLDREVGSAIVWVDPRWDRVPYDYYRPNARARAGSIKDLRDLAAEEADLWFVAERFPGQPIPSSPSESWLDEHWHLVAAVPFYRLELRHYAAPP